MDRSASLAYPQEIGPTEVADVLVAPAAVVPAALEGARLLDAALDDVPEAIIVLDASMRVVAWNRAASSVTGFPASAALGGVGLFDGHTLTVDAAASTAEAALPPPASASRRFWEFRVKDFGGPLEDVVAAVVPLGHPDLGVYVHLVPRVRSDVATVPPPARRRGLEGLTPRELEILKLLAAGKTAKPIATQLSLSVPTVRTHIQHVLRKLGVHSCLEAAVVFLRSGGSFAVKIVATLLASGPAIA
jgi:DNA-binding CsgD family transcriptional regulator